MVNLRTVSLSCRTFSHYTTTVDLDEVNNIEEVIEAVVNDLDNYLKRGNLESLRTELQSMRFHNHDYTFEDMLIDQSQDYTYYLCDHREE